MARIGLLSDSHGEVERTAEALRLLRGEGAELILHLGDIESEAVLEELLGGDVRLVFGNCDDASRLGRHAERLGLTVDHPIGRLEIEGRRIAFTHGHLPLLVEEALREGVDWLFHGHTHQIRDQRVRTTRVVNPGALHRASRYTVAIVDPAAVDRAAGVRTLELPRGSDKEPFQTRADTRQ